MTFNHVSCDALECVSNKLPGGLDTFSESLNIIRKAAIREKEAYHSSILPISEEGSTGSDGYYSNSPSPMAWEGLPELEAQEHRTNYYRSDENDVESLALGSMAYGNILPAVSSSKKWQSLTDWMRFCDGYSDSNIPEDCLSGNWQREMWNLPRSPNDQFPQSPNHKIFPDPPMVLSNPVKCKAVIAEEFESQWSKKRREQAYLKTLGIQDVSFLFAVADNVKELKVVLSQRVVGIQEIWKTGIPGVLGVLFRTHELAKQAFTRQKVIGVQLVPHSTSRRHWYKNPSPKLHVVYETTRRLTVKSGKSFSHRRVGDFLMTDARMNKGCLIWADQMKGCRLRVVGFLGKFITKNGRVIVRNVPPSLSERKVIGWVSTCSITKTQYVLRLTGN